MKLREQSGWTKGRIAGAVLLTVAGALVGIEAWQDIFRIASRDEEASHIFLVPLVVVWLLWVRRRRLRHIELSGFFTGPILVAIGWAMYHVGDAQLWQSIWHLGAILIAVGCLLTALGTGVLREMLPAFLVLVFLIPVPGRVRQKIAVPMQEATARVTEAVFQVADVPLSRAGSRLSINGADVAIAEACNGLRMVFALTLVCYAFAFGNPLRMYARFLVLAASPVAAILCNVIRLIPTVYFYGYSTASFADTFHSISGWIMLFVAFLLLLGLLRLLRWSLIPVYQFTLAYD